MEITLKKETSEEGKVVVTINGQKLNSELSEKLTGATTTYVPGIFTPCQKTTMFFGEYSKRFEFKTLNKNNDLQSLKENLIYNVNMVKKWVKECKQKACVQVCTFHIDD